MKTEKLVRIALLGAVMNVAKWALSFLPNTELVSLLIVIYTLVFGREAFWMIVVFNLIEGLQWGFGFWWVSYMYTWPLLAAVVLIFKKLFQEEFLLWAVVSGVFGLCFGMFFAIAYIPVDLSYALTYWIHGLPWDIWHAVCNFILMLLLGKPLYKMLLRIRSGAFGES